ncbi:hypothetical protein [Haloarcula sp. JP-L23]|uniref:hypothetical protein n=1 Tax=Haloarcula sp. JP-L23 TaxID=2716717 RepID=UPI00140F2CF6|nr:hypothetical protein G9465_23785 [Haloarcula sp. JP-L23]
MEGKELVDPQLGLNVSVWSILGGEAGQILRRTAEYLPVMGVVSIFTVGGLVASGQRHVALYAMLALLSLCLYFALLDLNDETQSAAEATDSTLVSFVLTIVLVLYYNVVVFLTVALALSFQIAGFEAAAVLMATGYPIYDAEMASLRSPFSIAGALVVSLAVIAAGLRWAEQRVGTDVLEGDLASLERLRESTSVLQELVVTKTARGRQRLAS